MVALRSGSVVLVTFPFSDLSASKLRPAIVLAAAGRGDWILSQVTSNPYGDPDSLQLDDEDFSRGSLRRTSFARPSKLFTANVDLIAKEVGVLRAETLAAIIETVVVILRRG